MKREQLPLFDLQACQTPLDVRISIAQASLAGLFEENVPICVAFSGGKDSTVTADLVLTTARMQVTSSKAKPVVIITTSDTLVENPEVSQHYRNEMVKMRLYGEKHGFRVITRIAQPSLLSTWQMKILSGRGLPSFAGQNTDCSIDLKVKPQAALRKALFMEIKEAMNPRLVLKKCYSGGKMPPNRCVTRMAT